MSNEAQLSDGALALAYALGGNATFTLVSGATGARFTYKVRAHLNEDGEQSGRWFVSVLQGPDNTSHYGYLGTIFDKGRWGFKFYHGKKSKISRSAPSALAFAWAWERLAASYLPDNLEFFHSGNCCRCGRKLTVPESIETGIGPICAEKMAA